MKNRRNKQKFIKLILVFLLAASQIIAIFANNTGWLEVSAAAVPKLAITNLSLSVGQTHRLSVENADQVKWSSSKKSVATVSSKGLVRAKKVGRTTITATVGSKKLKCYVVVNDPSAQEKNILIAFFSQTNVIKLIANCLKWLDSFYEV